MATVERKIIGHGKSALYSASHGLSAKTEKNYNDAQEFVEVC